jgi:hypothetical protein
VCVCVCVCVCNIPTPAKQNASGIIYGMPGDQ